jgi:hypothetical protein
MLAPSPDTNAQLMIEFPKIDNYQLKQGIGDGDQHGGLTGQRFGRSAAFAGEGDSDWLRRALY